MAGEENEKLEILVSNNFFKISPNQGKPLIDIRKQYNI